MDDKSSQQAQSHTYNEPNTTKKGTSKNTFMDDKSSQQEQSRTYNEPKTTK